jgi:hypothetical protein
MIVLLAQGVNAVRRFLQLPFAKAMAEFAERWVRCLEDSEAATNHRYRDSARDRAAAEIVARR